MTTWLRRLRYLVQQRRLERELAEEMRVHREMAAHDRLRTGGSAEGVPRVMGNTTLAREDARAVWIAPWFDGLWQDVRHGARGLRRSPALVAVCALSLGLGIGLNTVLYMSVRAILGHQPSMSDAETVVGVEPGNSRQFAYPDLQDLRRSGIFADVLGFRIATMNMGGDGGRVEPVALFTVTANFFDLLGVHAAHGRTFSAAEAAPDRDPNVVVVTASFWRNAFGGDPAAIGRTLTFNGDPYVLVGVLPDGYRSVSGRFTPQVYVPISKKVLPTLDERGSPSLSVMARLKPGATAEQAQVAVTGLGAQLERTYPDRNDGMGRPASVFPAAELQFRGTPRQFRMLSALVGTVTGLVFVIACINVMGLLVARAVSRRREIAVRVAVGAGRVRVAQAMLVEGFLLVLTGALVGLPLAFFLDEIPLPAEIAWLQDTVTFDARLFAFALALVAVATLLCAVLPAWKATRGNAVADVRQSGETATPRIAVRQSLVIAQMAIAMVLMAGAVLCVRSQLHIANVDVGFTLDQGVVARFGLDPTQYPGAERARFAERVVERVAAVPGVTAAAAADLVPLGGDSLLRSFHPAGRTDVRGTRPSTYSIGPGYLQALGIRLRQGRDFDRGDTAGAATVAIVNETYARTYFAGRTAIGERIATADEPEAVVVGVVADHRLDTIGEAPKSVIYFTFAQRPGRLIVHARGASDPAALVAAIRLAIDEVDATVPVSVQTLRSATSLEFGMRRAATILMAAVGVVGLLLAMIGLYGVMSYIAASRVSEVGIRMALGASGLRIRGEMLQRAVRLVATGAAAGAAGAALLLPVFSTFLAGVSPLDPVSFASAAAVLVIVGIAATYLPVERMARVDPIRALRQL